MVIDTALFHAQDVILNAVEPEEDAPVVSAWSHDPGFQRAWGVYPPRPSTAAEMQKIFEEMEKNAECGKALLLGVRSRSDERLIGIMRFENIEISNGACYRFYFCIGDAQERGRGYGSQALALTLRYAFQELGLHRIALDLAADNSGGLRFLQRAGFSVETRRIQAIFSAGRRVDGLRLGILRPEWESGQPGGTIEPPPPAIPAERPAEESATAEDLWRGRLVRLCAPDIAAISALESAWIRQPAFARNIDTEPARLWSVKKRKEDNEAYLASCASGNTYLAVRALADDRLIGFVSIYATPAPHRDAWLSIGIGDEEFRAKGCGTDAMRLLIRYAFNELNLHRLSLNVLEYNQRAVLCYERLGFRCEGRERECCLRDGRRWDLINMGLLRQEWQARQQP